VATTATTTDSPEGIQVKYVAAIGMDDYDAHKKKQMCLLQKNTVC